MEISSFYTCVPKIIIIWFWVLERQSDINRIFCHFEPFFTLLPQPLPPPPFYIYMCTRKSRKIKILKLKKTSGDIIILHMYTINDIIWCMIPEIWSTIDRICHSGPFLPFQTAKASINWSSAMRKHVHVKKPSTWSLFIDYFPH